MSRKYCYCGALLDISVLANAHRVRHEAGHLAVNARFIPSAIAGAGRMITVSAWRKLWNKRSAGALGGHAAGFWSYWGRKCPG